MKLLVSSCNLIWAASKLIWTESWSQTFQRLTKNTRLISNLFSHALMPQRLPMRNLINLKTIWYCRDNRSKTQLLKLPDKIRSIRKDSPESTRRNISYVWDWVILKLNWENSKERLPLQISRIKDSKLWLAENKNWDRKETTRKPTLSA